MAIDNFDDWDDTPEDYTRSLGMIGLSIIRQLEEVEERFDDLNMTMKDRIREERESRDDFGSPVSRMIRYERDYSDDDEVSGEIESTAFLESLRASTFKVRLTNVVNDLVTPMMIAKSKLEEDTREHTEQQTTKIGSRLERVIYELRAGRKESQALTMRIATFYREFLAHPALTSLTVLSKATSSILFGFGKRESDNEKIIRAIKEQTEFLRTGAIDRRRGFFDFSHRGLVRMIGEATVRAVGATRGRAQRQEESLSRGERGTFLGRLSHSVFGANIVQKGREGGLLNRISKQQEGETTLYLSKNGAEFLKFLDSVRGLIDNTSKSIMTIAKIAKWFAGEIRFASAVYSGGSYAGNKTATAAGVNNRNDRKSLEHEEIYGLRQDLAQWFLDKKIFDTKVQMSSSITENRRDHQHDNVVSALKSIKEESVELRKLEESHILGVRGNMRDAKVVQKQHLKNERTLIKYSKDNITEHRKTRWMGLFGGVAKIVAAISLGYTILPKILQDFVKENFRLILGFIPALMAVRGTVALVQQLKDLFFGKDEGKGGGKGGKGSLIKTIFGGFATAAAAIGGFVLKKKGGAGAERARDRVTRSERRPMATRIGSPPTSTGDIRGGQPPGGPMATRTGSPSTSTASGGIKGGQPPGGKTQRGGNFNLKEIWKQSMETAKKVGGWGPIGMGAGFLAQLPKYIDNFVRSWQAGERIEFEGHESEEEIAARKRHARLTALGVNTLSTIIGGTVISRLKPLTQLVSATALPELTRELTDWAVKTEDERAKAYFAKKREEEARKRGLVTPIVSDQQEDWKWNTSGHKGLTDMPLGQIQKDNWRSMQSTLLGDSINATIKGSKKLSPLEEENWDWGKPKKQKTTIQAAGSTISEIRRNAIELRSQEETVAQLASQTSAIADIINAQMGRMIEKQEESRAIEQEMSKYIKNMSEVIVKNKGQFVPVQAPYRADSSDSIFGGLRGQ